MKRMIVGAAFAALALVSAQPGSAQTIPDQTPAPSPAPSGGGRGGGMQAMMAGLNLSSDQQAKIAAIMADARQKIQAGGDDPAARRATMQDAFAQISAVLTPDQQAKLAALRAARSANRAGGGG